MRFKVRSGSRGRKKIEKSFGEPNNFVLSELGLPVDPVDKGDGDLADGEPQLPRPDDHLHLEDVAF